MLPVDETISILNGASGLTFLGLSNNENYTAKLIQKSTIDKFESSNN